MILRRIARGIKDQDWVVITIEIMIVVIGIFLGMQVTEWNENRKEQDLTDSYQKNLLTDLNNDISTLDSRIEYLTSLISHGKAAIALLEAETKSDDDPVRDIIKFYWATNKWPYNSHQPTYDELKSSGRLDLIGNREARDSLITLYNRRTDAKEIGIDNLPYRRLVRGIVPVDVGASILNACESFSENDAGVTVIMLTQDCTIDMDPHKAKDILKQILKYPDLQHALNAQLSNLSTYRMSLNNLRGATENRIAMLRALITGETK